MNSDFATGCSSIVYGRPSQTHTICSWFKIFGIFGQRFSYSTGVGWSGMCPYAFDKFLEDPAPDPDTLLEDQNSCILPQFSGIPSTGG
ncbi:hypothetical protein AYI69_g10493 [Smittium culicis]|uniref:Uncharacterized protein n=1 Tax=Smittium culicis TaxID=133412 RepID=A0A1R1X5B5_9FUNG|nr:hypothetical protein AYI69_g10493 [Smittium culicis]